MKKNIADATLLAIRNIASATWRVIVTFSEFVICVRKNMGLSQKQLALAINVSYSTINRWENGHVVPSNLAVKSFFDFCENNFIVVPKELL